MQIVFKQLVFTNDENLKPLAQLSKLKFMRLNSVCDFEFVQLINNSNLQINQQLILFSSNFFPLFPPFFIVSIFLKKLEFVNQSQVTLSFNDLICDSRVNLVRVFGNDKTREFYLPYLLQKYEV
eukprot:TRINITY_DN25515_c0_g1_i3.p1 TRINITY_DN25515_c0_g1~~TRINITY_DN25515_c0_g1_i3.p1  ORF type:complete len:124 (-),score=3.34 TRINITY_DN25515_c0_g1_i3:25-396(-)